jgi:hypothetical protein
MLGRFDARVLTVGAVFASLACASNTAGSDTDRSVRGADTVGYQAPAADTAFADTSAVRDTSVQMQGDTIFRRDTVSSDTSNANAYQRGANLPDTAYTNRDTSAMGRDTSMMGRDSTHR